MTSSRLQTAAYVTTMVAAGLAIPVMAAMSGSLGRHLGSAPAATTILFMVAVAIAGGATASSGLPSLEVIMTAPRHLLFGGVCVAFYALSITFIGPRLGTANAILCVLLGQMICAAVIDQFGLLGAPAIEFTRARAFGLALMSAGLYFARSMPQSHAGS